MKLRAKVTDLNDVPEAYRGAYTKADDGFVFSGELDIEQEDVSGLKSALEKERGSAKAAKALAAQLQQQLEQYDGADPEAMKAILRQYADSEDQKLIKEGKFNELLDRKLENLRKDHQKQLADRQKEIDETKKQQQRWMEKLLQGELRAAAAKAGLHATAIDDAVIIASRNFALDGEGEVYAPDTDGSPLLGKDGKSPLRAPEWFEARREDKPHWFPATGSGTGSSGTGNGKGSSGGGSGKQIKRADFVALPPMEKQKAAMSGAAIVD